MKLLDLVSPKSATTVDNGAPLSNVFTDKNVNKKKKKMHKVAKGVYGLGGSDATGVDLSGDNSGDGGGE